MENLPLFQPKENNYHSNKIIDSRHEFSLLEKKLIYCIINNLDTSNTQQKDLFNDIRFRFPVSIFGEDYNYSAMKEAIKKITTRTITGGDDRKEKFWSITPIPSAKIEGGVVNITLYSEAVPYFIELKQKGYTQYQLDVALSLTSVYSQRLYELLKRWKDTRHWSNVPIERLKWLLGIDKKPVYNGRLATGKIKSKILDPAQKELSEKTDIEFTYTFCKEGRKVVAIDFEVIPKEMIKKIEHAETREDFVEILHEVMEKKPSEQMQILEVILNSGKYSFTQEQRIKITRHSELAIKFLEVHHQLLAHPDMVKTTPTRYIAGILKKIKKDF